MPTLREKILELLSRYDGKQTIEDYANQIHDLYVGWFKSHIKPLSDEEISKAFDSAFDKDVYFDHKPAVEEVMMIRFRAISQATADAIKREIGVKK